MCFYVTTVYVTWNWIVFEMVSLHWERFHVLQSMTRIQYSNKWPVHNFSCMCVQMSRLFKLSTKHNKNSIIPATILGPPSTGVGRDYLILVIALGIWKSFSRNKNHRLLNKVRNEMLASYSMDYIDQFSAFVLAGANWFEWAVVSQQNPNSAQVEAS